MSEAFLKRAVKKHFKALGYTVRMRRIRLGNAEIDGEALGVKGERIAIEVKTPNDDVVRGVGQIAEASAFGYNQVVLVTTLRNAKKINGVVFHYYGWALLGVDAKGELHEILSTKPDKLISEMTNRSWREIKDRED